MSVRIAAMVQPVPPEAVSGMSFRSVEFDGLTVTLYVNESDARPRIAFSIRATELRAPRVGTARPSKQDAA